MDVNERNPNTKLQDQSQALDVELVTLPKGQKIPYLAFYHKIKAAF